MSRHRHVRNLVGEALEDYDDDDDYHDDHHSSSSSSSSTADTAASAYLYDRNAAPQRSVATFITRPAGKTGGRQSSAAASAPLPPPHPPAGHASRPAAVAAGFTAGDYADDDYIPPDDSSATAAAGGTYAARPDDYDYADDEQQEEYWEDEVDHSAYDDYQPAAAQQRRQPSTPSTGKKAKAAAAPVTTPKASKAKPSINTGTPSFSTPQRAASPASSSLMAAQPPARVQRSAAEEAETAAAVEALRLEKLRLSSSSSSSSSSSLALNRSSSSHATDSLLLSRTLSPAPASPSSSSSSTLTPRAAMLRSSSSADQLSSQSAQRRLAARQAVLEAEERKDSKPTLNVVVIGHVDAGKSTLMGHLLYLLGRVSGKQMHRYEKESREMGKASFHFAWVLDQQEEERTRGITVDVAVQHFDTDSRRVTLLDAPGHRDFIPNMISGAAQADAAVLVVPAATGEFEAGFAEEGQIREHAILARSLGVAQLVVAVNKLDMVEWREERYRQVLALLLPFLRSTGFKEKDVQCVPVSGLTGENLVARKEEKLSSWYSGPTLLQLIDTLPLPRRSVDRPFRCCISEVFRSQSLGVTVAGRIDSGCVMKGDSLLILPQGELVSVRGVERDGEQLAVGRVGENVDIGLKELTDSSVLTAGLWLCDPAFPIPMSCRFRAQILTTALSRPLLQGATLLLYTQSASEEVQLSRLVALLDRSSGSVIKTAPRFLSRNASAEVELQCKRAVCLELYRDYRELGRFSLRRATETVAVGIVTELF